MRLIRSVHIMLTLGRLSIGAAKEISNHSHSLRHALHVHRMLQQVTAYSSIRDGSRHSED